MKRLFPLIIITISLLLNGCTKKDEKPETETKKTETTTPPVTTTPPTNTTTEKKENANPSSEEKKESKEPEKKEELRDKSGAIRVRFPAGSTEISLNGKINGFGDKITYVLDAKKGQGLYARVIATYANENPNSNVRIAQIISPSGKSDGPIGIKTIKDYDLTESGDWKIVISENQMSGNPWKGEYTLQIAIH